MTELREILREHTIPAAPALSWHEGGAIRCAACANRCLISEGRAGICCVRANRGGELRVPGGYVAGLQLDPIEKKPFFHVYPGCTTLSFGMLGCNFRCPFCQNWISSQVLRDEAAVGRVEPIEPDEIVSMAVEAGAPVMVSTYNEPLITSDWAALVFERARERGITCGYVSNGHATPEVLNFLRPFMSLYKVDLKCFDEAHYGRLGGRLHVVLDTIELLKAMGFWVEVVTLVVPGFNDSDEELKAIANFLATVSVDIPWHVTGFRPMYKMRDVRATRVEDLARAYHAGREAGLRYVYAGNLRGVAGNGENTLCPSCGRVLVERDGFSLSRNRLTRGTCPDCGEAVAGVWEPGLVEGTGL